MKRLAIFSVNSDLYEESKYVLFLLDEIIKCCRKIILCVSQNVEPEFLEKLRLYTEQIYQYDNYIDINRWRDVWVSHLCMDGQIKQFDEILFMNDSVFGPIYSLEPIFSEFENRDVDFWGMSVHGKMKLHQGDEYPRFLQTYFLCIRRKLFLSKDFNDFMLSQEKYKSYEDASKGFEFIFTEFFHNLGYRWDTYIDTSNREKHNSEYFMSFILFDLYNLVVNKGYPFIPKVIFEIPDATIQTYNMGDDLYRTLKYIQRSTEYDIELLYQNVIKRLDLRDIASKLKLNFIIQPEQMLEKVQKKYALFAHLYYEDLFDYSIDKILNVPNYFDIFISTDTSEKADKIKTILCKKAKSETVDQVCIEVFSGRGRDLASLLVCFRKRILEYDIFCFIHDKKSSQMDYITVGDGFNRNIWESMLESPGYINGVLKILEEDRHLGMLAPPMVCHGTYFHTAISSWTICYQKTLEAANMLGVKININESKNPIALGSAFWSKTSALKKILEYDFSCELFPKEPMPVDGTFSHAIERIFPYIAQEAGYYTGNIMTNAIAANRIGLLEDTVSKLMREICQVDEIDAATYELTLLSLQNRRERVKQRKKKKRKRKLLNNIKNLEHKKEKETD